MRHGARNATRTLPIYKHSSRSTIRSPFQLSWSTSIHKIAKATPTASPLSAKVTAPSTAVTLLKARADGVTNFSVFSEPAERVELCLFGDDGTEPAMAQPFLKTGQDRLLVEEQRAQVAQIGSR